MRALCRLSALTSPIALRLGPLLSRLAGEDECETPSYPLLTTRYSLLTTRSRPASPPQSPVSA